MSNSTTIPTDRVSVLPEGQVQVGVGEGGKPVYASAFAAAVMRLSARYATQGGDIRPLYALMGYPRYAAFLEEGHRLLKEMEAAS